MKKQNLALCLLVLLVAVAVAVVLVEGQTSSFEGSPRCITNRLGMIQAYRPQNCTSCTGSDIHFYFPYPCSIGEACIQVTTELHFGTWALESWAMQHAGQVVTVCVTGEAPDLYVVSVSEQDQTATTTTLTGCEPNCAWPSVPDYEHCTCREPPNPILEALRTFWNWLRCLFGCCY